MNRTFLAIFVLIPFTLAYFISGLNFIGVVMIFATGLTLALAKE